MNIDGIDFVFPTIAACTDSAVGRPLHISSEHHKRCGAPLRPPVNAVCVISAVSGKENASTPLMIIKMEFIQGFYLQKEMQAICVVSDTQFS